MLKNNFKQDIELIYSKIKSRDKFAFSKYADGEYKVLINEAITNCDGWTFNPKIHIKEYKLLLESFKYEDDGYYVGISCPCCQPKSHVKWMRDHVGSSNLTWANIFVNSNYPFFVENFLNEFNNWEGKIILFANEVGINNNLPFRVDEYVPINLEAWKEPYLSKNIKKGIELSNIEDGQLFLFSAGPLGNILSYKLFSENKKNTYIDIGSTINPWIVGNNRGYLRGNIKKTCIW